MTLIPRIDTADDLARGVAHLMAVCPVWARIMPQIGPLPLRLRPEGFGAIAHAIVGQQISVAAAASVWAAVEAAGLDDPAVMRAASDEDLRLAKLSRPKQRYLRAIAASGMDWDGLRDLPDDQALAALVALPGVGVWTAEIYLMFALGRPDVIAAGDLAMQEAARLVFDLDGRPTAPALRIMAETWRPWRAVAARGLWEYYLHLRHRKGIL